MAVETLYVSDGKSPTAYRTISETADILDLPAHVLRFWETKFPNIKPMTRAGGRRFYRPEDIAALRAIQIFLHEDGLSIQETKAEVKTLGHKNLVARGFQYIHFGDENEKPETGRSANFDSEANLDNKASRSPRANGIKESNDRANELSAALLGAQKTLNSSDLERPQLTDSNLFSNGSGHSALKPNESDKNAGALAAALAAQNSTKQIEAVSSHSEAMTEDSAESGTDLNNTSHLDEGARKRLREIDAELAQMAARIEAWLHAA